MVLYIKSRTSVLKSVTYKTGKHGLMDLAVALILFPFLKDVCIHMGHAVV